MAHDDLFDLPGGSPAAARIDEVHGASLAAGIEEIERTAPVARPPSRRRRTHQPRRHHGQLAQHDGMGEPGPSTAELLGISPDDDDRSEGAGTQAEPMPRLTGFDIRTKDFGRAWFGRGYRCADVDEYLAAVATTMDELDAEALAPAGGERSDPAAVVLEALAGSDNVGSSYAVLQQARRVAEEAIADAEHRADRIIESATTRARELHLEVRRHSDTTLDDARVEAAAILDRARRDARTIVTEARERANAVPDAPAEPRLRLAD